jgi:hypothetical protein
MLTPTFHISANLSKQLSNATVIQEVQGTRVRSFSQNVKNEIQKPQKATQRLVPRASVSEI